MFSWGGRGLPQSSRPGDKAPQTTPFALTARLHEEPIDIVVCGALVSIDGVVVSLGGPASNTISILRIFIVKKCFMSSMTLFWMSVLIEMFKLVFPRGGRRLTQSSRPGGQGHRDAFEGIAPSA